MDWITRLLRLQARVLPREENDAMIEVGLPSRGRVLDVGCGNGEVARRIKEQLPELEIEGIERAAFLAKEAVEGLARVHAIDALAEWDPAAIGGFDCTYARVVLRHAADPEALVARMTAAVKPGGRVVICDADDLSIQLWPPVAELGPALSATHAEALVTNGPRANPRAAVRLAEYARKAGLVDLALRSVVMTTKDLERYGVPGPRSFADLLGWLWLDPRSGEVRPDRAAVKAGLDAWAAAPDAFGMRTLLILGGTRAS